MASIDVLVCRAPWRRAATSDEAVLREVTVCPVVEPEERRRRDALPPRLPANAAISIARRLLPETNRHRNVLDFILEVVVRYVIATTRRPLGNRRHATVVPEESPIP